MRIAALDYLGVEGAPLVRRLADQGEQVPHGLAVARREAGGHVELLAGARVQGRPHVVGVLVRGLLLLQGELDGPLHGVLARLHELRRAVDHAQEGVGVRGATTGAAVRSPPLLAHLLQRRGEDRDGLAVNARPLVEHGGEHGGQAMA
jgi:hypothetical protein